MYLVKKDVFRLQIAVQYIVIVHILQSVTYLLHHHPDLVLGETTLLFEVVVHVSICTQLHQQVKVAVLDEHRVELGHVGVVQEGLDLYLADQLHQHLGVRAYVALDYLLQGEQETCFLVPGLRYWYLTRQTWPILPCPSILIGTKSSSFTFSCPQGRAC